MTLGDGIIGISKLIPTIEVRLRYLYIELHNRYLYIELDDRYVYIELLYYLINRYII